MSRDIKSTPSPPGREGGQLGCQGMSPPTSGLLARMVWSGSSREGSRTYEIRALAEGEVMPLHEPQPAGMPSSRCLVGQGADLAVA
jgi:hypothetical protein